MVASTPKTVPSGFHTKACVRPPSPDWVGSVTARAKAVATAASTALPPLPRISAPARVACSEPETTIPSLALAVRPSRSTASGGGADSLAPHEQETAAKSSTGRRRIRAELKRPLRKGQSRTWSAVTNEDSPGAEAPGLPPPGLATGRFGGEPV